MRFCSEFWKEGLQGILTVPLLLAKVLTRLRGHGDSGSPLFPSSGHSPATARGHMRLRGKCSFPLVRPGFE